MQTPKSFNVYGLSAASRSGSTPELLDKGFDVVQPLLRPLYAIKASAMNQNLIVLS